MLLSLEKKIHTHTHKQKTTTTKETKTKETKETTYSSPCLHHKWRCYQAIALNNQQIGSTSLALLSP